MAKTATYSLIQETTLTGSQNNFTFNSIPATFTDIKVEAFTRAATGGGTWGMTVRFNGDTTSNYSYVRILGEGSTPVTDRGSNQTAAYVGNITGGGMTANQYSHTEMELLDYSNTTTHKVCLSKNSSSLGAYSMVNTWRTTNAINSIQFIAASDNFVAGTTFRIYGIEAGNI